MQKLDLAMHLVTERKERIYNSYDYDYENQETYRLSVCFSVNDYSDDVVRKLNYRKFSFEFDNKDLLGIFTTFVRVAYEVGLYEKLSFNEIGDRLSKLLEESTGLSKGFGSGW